MRLHASCAARVPAGGAACGNAQGGEAILLLGPPGSGKSDLLLRLIQAGFVLVADDQVFLEDGMASPAPALAGLLEVRGLGIFRLPYQARAKIKLVINLGIPLERLPLPQIHATLGVPEITLDPAQASAAARAGLALEAACGRITQLAGAFAA